jgi:5-(carboxyamino)imidazole ribonucleotide synthase
MAPIAPGKTIGILGGGQLGRMLAIAAAEMGYRTHVFCPEADPCAAPVANDVTIADYEDHTALGKFAKAVDVVTLEFENVPVAACEFLARIVPVRPGAGVLRIAQDRLLEKQFAQKLKIPTAEFYAVDSLADLERAVLQAGLPAILKTRRFGYDGKGQVKIKKPSELAGAWEAIGRQSAILEAMVDFKLELSVIVARSPSGEVVTFPAVENRHKNHILDETIVPAPIYPRIAKAAETMARKMAQQIKLQGLMAVEMFLGARDVIYMNEIAPRPHNSGHWSIDACITSQFTQAIRAVCDLPLGSTAILSPCRMKNLLGDMIYNYERYLTEPNTKLHLYGKDDPKPGRKMGHITRLLRK